MSRILICEDDPGVRDILRNLFEAEGFEVHEADSGRETMANIDRLSFDVVTMDLSLDRDDGLALTRAIRQRSAVPIIIISAKTSDVDRIVGLEVGADDYVVKPFNPREVLARVRAVLRRTDPLRGRDVHAPSQTFCFAGFVFDPIARCLTDANGDGVDLTNRELELLEILLRRPGRVLSRDTLLSLLGSDNGEALDRAVDSLVARLRRKLADAGGDRHVIETARGLGYRFTARVETLDA